VIYKIIAIYLILVNTSAFIAYGIDKSKAKNRKWRTPETILLLYALLGGSLGALLGMAAFHHKTRKAQFYSVVFVIFIIQVALILYWYVYYYNHDIWDRFGQLMP